MLCKLPITPHCKKFNYSKVGRSLIWLATWKKQLKCLGKKKKKIKLKEIITDTFFQVTHGQKKTKYTNIHDKVKQCQLIMGSTTSIHPFNY